MTEANQENTDVADNSQQQNSQFDSNKQREKVYTSLVYGAIISSIMLFAGLSSAVLVRKMDKFWVNIHLPDAFVVSLVLIAISSFTFYMALKAAKKGTQKTIKIYITSTILLGLGFCFFQFQGWTHYYQNGNAVKSFITYIYGQYGQSYRVYKNNIPIIYNGEYYEIEGEALSNEDKKELQLFAYKICGEDRAMIPKAYEISNYGDPFSIVTADDSTELSFIDAIPYKNDKELTNSKRDELFKFAFGIYHDHPFFMLKGNYGKDFTVSLNGENLDYNKKKLYFPEKVLTNNEKKSIDKKIFQGGVEYHLKDGKIFISDKEHTDKNFETYFYLDQGIEIKIKDGIWRQNRQELNSNQYGEFFQTTNVASSFVWVLTVIHILHVFLGLVVILIVFVRAIKEKYNIQNQVGLKAAGVFWHFVGVLWVYLYLFLEFIN